MSELQATESFVWTCGHCEQPTSVSHFYEDRATGTMGHCADEQRRVHAANLCGWQFDDSYVAPYRCGLSHDHRGDHNSGGVYPVRWSDTTHGAMRPHLTLPGVRHV